MPRLRREVSRHSTFEEAKEAETEFINNDSSPTQVRRRGNHFALVIRKRTGAGAFLRKELEDEG